jgi:hypothetical protein
MKLDDVNERAGFFARLVDSLDGKNVVDNIYHVICTYGIPAVADEEFLIASLMEVYLIHEEYEKCEVLKKREFKMNVSYDSLHDLDDMIPESDIKYMALMGFFKSIKVTSL